MTPNTGDITSVAAGAGLAGGGSSGNVTLSVPIHGILPSMVNGDTAALGTVLKWNGTNGAAWTNDGLTLPYSGSSSSHPAFSLSSDGGHAIVGTTSADSTAYFGVVGSNQTTINGSGGVRGNGYYRGVFGFAKDYAGTGFGVDGVNQADQGAGVRGVSTKTSGEVNGVTGESRSADGVGVYGHNTATGSGAHGVLGETLGNSGWASGVYGAAQSSSSIGVTGWNSGSGPGLYAWSQEGLGLIVKGSGSGNLAEIHDHAVGLRWKVTHSGNVFADGVFQGGGADFVEMMPVRRRDLEPGDVVVMAADGRLTRSFEERQASVVGVISTRPGFLGDLYLETPESEKAPLAVVGIVPVKATAENGEIRPGDMLTPSAIPGTAMRSRRIVPGTVIGKAVEGLESGEGLVRMLVMLR